MKRRHGLSRIVVLSICVISLLSLVEVPEREPYGLHLDSEMISSLLDDGPRVATVAMLPGLSPRRSGPVDACLSPPYEAGPRSSSVQRI